MFVRVVWPEKDPDLYFCLIFRLADGEGEERICQVESVEGRAKGGAVGVGEGHKVEEEMI